MEHYMSNIKTNVVKLLGSSDLIGNPVNFVNTLGTGLKDVYYAPRDGFMQGPLQGGIGILKGAKSAVTHTIGGAAGSVGKITNSLNKGVLFLAFDEEYSRKKELNDIKEKPKGTIDGIAKGFKGFGKSLFSGVTGVVTKPVEGVKEDGFKGFFTGLGKGATGLVTKPISGVVDVVSKTTQGIDISVSGGECLPNNHRCRKPRAFYKHVNIFKDFSFLHSEAYFALRNAQKVKPESFRKMINSTEDFFAAFRITRIGVTNEKEINTHVLLLSKTSLFDLNRKLEFKWMRKHTDIVRVTTNDNELHIHFAPRAGLNGFGEIKSGKHLKTESNGQTQTVVIYLEDSQQAKQAADCIEEIKTALLFELNSNSA
jgi:vacuolar protein sorting-associated protein 13A/C